MDTFSQPSQESKQATTTDGETPFLHCILVSQTVSMASDAKDKPLLPSAPPPWHSVALITLLLALSLAHLPSTDSLDQVATQPIFCHTVFPEYLSLQQLAWVRWSMAAVILGTSLQTALLSQG